MPEVARIVAPGPNEHTVCTAAGETLAVPAGWELLPPGDAGLTRRVKAAGPTWTVQVKKGRKLFSRGLWAPAANIAQARAALEAERSTEAYARRRARDTVRRERQQGEYVEDFRAAVLAFLNFAPAYTELAERLADAVTAHATPVGSGTVARTQRIAIEERASSAVIAWMRHQTTAYDSMAIPRERGKRREVRRMLAVRSRQLLENYRLGRRVDTHGCPLAQALADRSIAAAPPV